MAQQQFGAAQPIADFFKRIVNFSGPTAKSSGGSSTNSGSLPKQWEEANEQSISKPAGKKTPKRRARARRPVKKASVARKR